MQRTVIVIGGSAGALDPLHRIVRALPPKLAAAVLVVIHVSPTAPSALPELLGRNAALPVAFAADGEPLRSGRILVAPANHHLLLGDGRVELTRGPRENGFRPAIDPLFRTAARWYGPRAIGVVLSGGLDDGTFGLRCIKEAGGVTIVQRPEDATVPGMPASALRTVPIDHVVDATEIGPLLATLARDAIGEAARPAAAEASSRREPAAAGARALADGSLAGPPSVFTCPACGGTLWELGAGSEARFACHVGHAYSPDALENGMADVLDSALWTALRTLEENAAFFRRMHARSVERGLHAIAAGYDAKSADARARADVVRRVLTTDDAAAALAARAGHVGVTTER